MDHRNLGVIHDAKATIAFGCANDQEVLEGHTQELPTHELVFGWFTGVLDLHRPLGPVPDGVPQRPQSRVRVGDQVRKKGGEDGPIRVVDCKQWQSVGGGNKRKTLFWGIK